MAAIVGTILFGTWLLVSGNGGLQASFSNLWQQGGFVPHGISGLVIGYGGVHVWWKWSALLRQKPPIRAAEFPKPRSLYDLARGCTVISAAGSMDNGNYTVGGSGKLG